MTPRATPLTADDRRQAIVDVLLPLLVQRGAEVSTREIAAAAGIAEGTIFRVFPDKRSLMLAAAEEAINPAHGQEEFDAAMASARDLRHRVVVACERVQERMRLTMTVMMAVRSHLMAAHEEAAGGHDHGPPPFVLKAQADLTTRLAGVFEPHRAELAVEPEVAAVALRSLVLGSGRPELGLAPVLTPDKIADLLLDGVRKRES